MAGRVARLVLGLTVALFATAALTGGYMWVALGELMWLDVPAIGRWTVMTLHAWVGLVLVPLVLIHLFPRRWRLLRPGARAVERARDRVLTRRALLVGGTLGLAGAAAWAGVAAIELARGGTRRFTGSRWLPAGGVPIPTTSSGRDAGHRHGRVAAIGERRGWGRPLVARGVGRQLGDVERAAVLDCTSGWALETSWRGSRSRRSSTPPVMARPPPGRRPFRDRLVHLAAVADAPVPARLVGRGPAATCCQWRASPPGRADRRGLEWVKWIAEISVS